MNADFQVRAGDLKHPITIRIRPTAATGTRAPNGEIDTSLAGTSGWTIRCSPRAGAYPTKGIELTRSEREVSELWMLFVILYRADVPVPTDRIIWRERVFDVISVTDVEGQSRRLDLQTIEVK